MFHSSKSTRKFSKRGIILAILLLVFISGYSLYQLAPSAGYAASTTSKEDQTSAMSTTTSIGSSTTVQTNTSVSTEVNATTSTFTSTSSLTTTTTSNETTTTSNETTTTSNETTTALPSGPTIFTISQSKLLEWLNLSSSSAKLIPSSTKVPYYIVSNSSGSTTGLLYLTTDVAPNSCWGYNGPIGTLVLVNATGFIEAITIYSIVDSWGYKITQTWLNTLVGRSVFERLQIGNDVAGVTGATFSSEGVIDGVRDAGRIVVNDYQQQQKANPMSSSFGTILILGGVFNIFGSLSRELGLQAELSMIALVALFAAAVVSFELKSDKIRYGVYIGSVAFMGFYIVRMVSIGDFVAFIRWAFPPILRDPFWYVLYGGVLVTSLLWGRFYCGYLCPFGSFTELLNKISPVQLKVPYRYQSKLRLAKYPILAAVIFELLSGTVLYQIEPFGTLFLFSGDTFAWIFLGLIVGTSIFIDRFYCTYICPAGTGLALLSWFRIREIKRWPECKKCLICANKCSRQAIKGDRISSLECMNCRECEKLYQSAKICPHYARERISKKKRSLVIS